jgi:peptide/nickel transport system ATP-binding protein
VDTGATVTPALLDVRDLRIAFGPVRAVDGLTLTVAPAEAVALVGESGCGKSTTALSIMGLLPRQARLSGRIVLAGSDVLSMGKRALREMRGNVASMIFQEPMSSLNPMHRIGDQIIEALRSHTDISRRAARRQAIELLDLVRLPDPQRRVDDYPHRLSGGQRQRVMIAMAVACRPRLLIADEATTALDATIQAQILELLDGLRRDLSMALLLITHDLSLVQRWSHRVIVMHHGEKMEELASRHMAAEARHPYTKGLLGASIRLDQDLHYSRRALPEIRTRRDEAGRYTFELTVPPQPAAPTRAPGGRPLVSVRNLVMQYRTRRGAFRAVDDISFDIAAGETLGVVGESGSGKSSLSKALLRLVPILSGSIAVDGEDVSRLSGTALRRVRRRMQMIFQDPFNSLNPRQSVGTILERALAAGGMAERSSWPRLIREMLDHVGLPAAAVGRFPHEFSGGQKQRIGIARALIVRPSLVVCDEPVSALDVSVQAQILNLLIELKQTLGLSYLFISHDLAVVQYVSDRVMVMRQGRIVEQNDRLEIWTSPRDDYTRALIRAVARDA